MLVYSYQLIPHDQYPIIERSPYKLQNSKLTLVFSFHQMSYGLSYGQYLNVKFPKNINFELDKLDKDNLPKFLCSLYDNDGISYKLTPEISFKPEIIDNFENTIDRNNYNNSVFCKLDDTNYAVLKTNLKIYYLTIEFKELINSKFISYIQLSTTTSNSFDSIIIDSIASIGSKAQFETYKRKEFKLLEITSAKLINKSNNCNIQNDINCNEVYPYNYFNIEINLKSKMKLETRFNCVIVINYPNSNVDDSKLLLISKLSNKDNSQKSNNYYPLTEIEEKKITYSKLSDSSILIENIGEDLDLNREFLIELQNLYALDSNLNVVEDIEVIVYWKNTYSILSYDSSSIFKINYGKISYNREFDSLDLPKLFTGISHPEYWDIYENGAWPIKFTFNSNIDLINGGYILIRQTNTMYNSNKFNFIASTCDFSDNNLVLNNQENSESSNDFEKKPMCFPLRTDFKYEAFDTNDYYNGSGIYFKLKNIKKNKKYTLTVWGYAESCGNYSVNNSFPDPSKNIYNLTEADNNENYVFFEFGYTIYKSIDQTKIAEEVFSENNILAKSIPIKMNNKCWGAITEEIDQSNLFATFYESYNIGYNNKNQNILMYKEIYNFNVSSIDNEYNIKDECLKITDNNIKNLNNYNCFITDNIKYPNKNMYFYSSIEDKQIKDNSFFFINLELDIGANINYNNYAFMHVPMPIEIDMSENKEKNILKKIYQPGKLNIQFSNKFYIEGNDINNCFFSWANFYGNKNKAKYENNSISSITNQTSLIPKHKNNDLNNFIISDSKDSEKNTIDINNSNIYGSKNFNKYLPFSITSYANNALSNDDNFISQNSWTFLAEAVNYHDDNNSNIFNINLFSNCVKTISNIPQSIKTVYTYFDIQIQWMVEVDNTINNTKNYVVNRNIRLIRLLPEYGVFNNEEKLTSYERNPVVYHYSYGISMYNNSVCLLQISGISLLSLIENNANSIFIWLNNIVLLDIDREDITAYYPVAPLKNGIISYGYNSALSHTINNKYTKERSNNSMSSIDSNKNMLMDIYNQKLVNSINPKTYYHLYMSSMIVITGIEDSYITSDNSQDILIPYYCPIEVTNKDNINYIPYNSQSTIISSFNINIESSFNTNMNLKNKLNINLTQNIKNNEYSNLNVLSPVKKILTSTSKFRYAVFFNKDKNNKLAQEVLNIKLNFQPYTTNKNENENTLYISIPKSNVNSEVYKCSGFSLFVSNKINIENDIMSFNYISNNNNQLLRIIPNKYYVPGKSFYIFGKKFEYAFLFALSTNINLAYSLKADSQTNIYLSDHETNYYFKGISRPNTEFIKNSSKGFSDLLGFACNSNDINYTNSISNYKYQENLHLGKTSIEFYSFVVDYSNLLTSWEVMVKTDNGINPIETKLGNIVKDANVLINVSIPSVVPEKSFINFSSKNNLNSLNAVCGINNPLNSIDETCSYSFKENTKVYKCKLPQNSNLRNINICCYNIKIDPNESYKNLSDYYLFSLDNLYVNTNTDYLKNYSGITTNIVEFDSSEKSKLKFGILKNSISSIEDLSNKISMTLIAYTQAKNKSAFGKAIFEISTPIRPFRGMQLKITGNLNELAIKNIIQKCQVSFDKNSLINNKNSIDLNFDSIYYRLINSCNLGDLHNSNPLSPNSITIDFKNIIFKCSISSSKEKYSIFNIYLAIYPVIVYDFSSSVKVNIDLNFKYPYSDNENKLYLSGSTTINVIQNAISNGNFYTSSLSLCNAISITPKLVSEIATYKFKIELHKSPGWGINEVTLFLTDDSMFEPDLKDIMCSIDEEENTKDNLLNCQLNEGILNIKLNKIYVVDNTTPEYLYINIHGIRNKDIYAIYPKIACTINNYDLNTKNRNVIVSGLGTLEDIPLVSNVSNINNQGNLRFINNYDSNIINNENKILANDEKDKVYSKPRESDNYYIRITPDKTLNSVVFPLTITNKPILIITFDSLYNIYFNYYLNKPDIDITEYLYDNNGFKLKSELKPTINKVVVQGNQFVIYLSDTVWNFPINFMFWEITIYNFKNPTDVTVSKTLNVLLTNTNYTYLFKTYSNLINLAYYKLDNQNIDFKMIRYTRGKVYKFNRNQHVVDIYPSNSELNKLFSSNNYFYNTNNRLKYLNSNVIQDEYDINLNNVINIYANKIELQPGLFKTYSFRVRSNIVNSNNSNIESDILYNFDKENTKIYLEENNKFSLYENEYNIKIHPKTNVKFQIASICNIPEGIYILSFLSSSTKYKLSLIQVKITNNFEEKGKIKLYYDSNFKYEISEKVIMPKNSILFIYYKLIDQTNEDLIIKWNNKLDNIGIEPLKIPKKSYLDLTKFYVKENFEENAIEVFDAAIVDNHCYETIPKKISFLIKGELTNLNNSGYSIIPVNNNLQDVSNINSLSFNFLTKNSPFYLTCKLLCNEIDFDTDNKDWIIPSNIKNELNNNNNNLVRYYSTYVSKDIPNMFKLISNQNNSEDLSNDSSSVFNDELISEIPINMNNLVRGLKYKMICSMQMNIYNKALTSNILNLTVDTTSSMDSESNENQNIIVTKSMKPNCINIIDIAKLNEINNKIKKETNDSFVFNDYSISLPPVDVSYEYSFINNNFILLFLDNLNFYLDSYSFNKFNNNKELYCLKAEKIENNLYAKNFNYCKNKFIDENKEYEFISNDNISEATTKICVKQKNNCKSIIDEEDVNSKLKSYIKYPSLSNIKGEDVKLKTIEIEYLENSLHLDDESKYDSLKINDFNYIIEPLLIQNNLSSPQKVVDINKLYFKILSITPYNTLFFESSFIRTVKCKFSFNNISPSNKISSTQIENCSLDGNICGEFTAGPYLSTHYIKIKKILRPQLYYIWIFCKENLPEDYFSNYTPINFGNFTGRKYDKTQDPDEKFSINNNAINYNNNSNLETNDVINNSTNNENLKSLEFFINVYYIYIILTLVMLII